MFHVHINAYTFWVYLYHANSGVNRMYSQGRKLTTVKHKCCAKITMQYILKAPGNCSPLITQYKFIQTIFKSLSRTKIFWASSTPSMTTYTHFHLKKSEISHFFRRLPLFLSINRDAGKLILSKSVVWQKEIGYTFNDVSYPMRIRCHLNFIRFE